MYLFNGQLSIFCFLKLDPLEKEWLKCAAIGHLAALSDLLRQDPSLAMKKVTIATCDTEKLHGEINATKI